MKRPFISVVVGLLSGILVITLLESIIPNINLMVFGDKLSDSNETIIKSNLIFVLIAWGAGAFSAGFVTSLITGNIRYSILTSVLLLLGAIINFFIVPHPWWFIALALSIFLPLSSLANILVNKYLKNS
jgi:hypothetical protein